MSSNNPLDNLSKVSECSISGLFQELLNKGFQSSSHNEQSSLKFGDADGSDFKRLHKKDNSRKRNARIQTTHAPTVEVITTASTNKTYHQGSPDFRPVVRLPKPTSAPARSMFANNALYNFLFQHEDRYFNNDRAELSKDIFPAGYEQRA